MKIGVIGAGGIGGTVGTLWAKAGHEVLFSSRNPDQLTDLVVTAGANTKAGTIAQATAFANVILLAVYYWTTDAAIAAGSLDEKILIDATNPYIREADKIIRVTDTSSGLELAAKVPNAKVVKAYNTLPTATFANEARRADPYALFYCGDDAPAKAIVAHLIADSGFAGVISANWSK
ncbi:NADPH-dependent F420 reductase [Komarekiella delphini-convector]|uniref:NADPH-dependent F420 reductase n=1 Tax=Komarekiella delphini-convector TaxID=3050158 RepID=UPI001CD8CFC4|nr:NAD(P)-binding domain-containing protein [Komarekiella delphini-convector]